MVICRKVDKQGTLNFEPHITMIIADYCLVASVANAWIFLPALVLNSSSVKSLSGLLLPGEEKGTKISNQENNLGCVGDL